MSSSSKSSKISPPAVNLAAVDLNLLTAFEALYSERHVTRAAVRVGRSQSAMSHTLARLRDLFEDELFVRIDNEFAPTRQADELSELILPALQSLRAAIEQKGRFDPATSNRHFRIGMSDVASFLLLPAIMPDFRSLAPGIDISVIDTSTSAGVADVENGQLEFAIGYFPQLPTHIENFEIRSLDTVGMADSDNPFLKNGQISLEAFLAAPHVCSTISNDPLGTDIDRHLSTHYRPRRIALRLSNYLALPSAIRGTDLIATIERAAFRRLPDIEDIVTFELPFARPDTNVLAIWHQRHNHDMGHVWLRNLLEGRFRNLPDHENGA
jgi:DNA-binding transcriptional LysR family regulator